MEATGKNKAVMKRFYEDAFNKGDLSIIDELFDKNFVDRSIARKETRIRDIKPSFKEFRKAFPDMNIKIEDMLAEGNKVATRFIFQGTHKGEFIGTAPTGKKVKMRVIDIITLKNGKAIERIGVEDNLSMWQQLGKKLK